MADDDSLDSFMELASGASAMKGLFDGMIAAGFTEDQAMNILVKMWIEFVKIGDSD